jgi:hypothetical protein
MDRGSSINFRRSSALCGLLIGAPKRGLNRSQNETCQNYFHRNIAGFFISVSVHVGNLRNASGPEKNQWYDLVNKGTKSMKKLTSLSESHLTQLVERGYAIHQQLSLLTGEFKQIKDRLKTEGLARPGEHVPLADSESDGDQWIVQASRCECRIIFPGPRLKSEFDPTLRGFATMRNLAENHYDKLFREVTNVQIIDRDCFRAYAKSLLPAGTCHRLFELCSIPSEPKALWKARAGKSNR